MNSSDVTKPLQETTQMVTPENGGSLPDKVTIVSPSDLPGGYQFNVVADNRALVVSVPEGGVKEGQEFTATVLGESTAAAVSLDNNIPTGMWRDGLFDCCRLGCLHPQMWLTYFCLPIALGQVLTRLNLDWFASPVQRATTCSAFKILAISCLAWVAIDNAIYLLLYPYTTTVQYDDDQQANGVYTSESPVWASAVDAVRQGIGAAYGIFILILTIRARHYIRSKYSIPEQQCTGCEDCCCTFWCHCCTVAQMARHVNDYEHYKASCCSETGLDSHAPLIV